MRELVWVVMMGLVGTACWESVPDVHDQAEGGVGKAVQFLSGCSVSCPEPLSCVCGV